MAHIYVVDDERDVRDTLALFLESHGHRVVVAHEPGGVHAYVASQFPDLVILDLLFPNGDGMTILDELVNDPATQTVPVIMISAQGQKRKIIQGLEKGAFDYLHKPFSNEVLLARVNAALTIRELEHSRRRNDALAALPQTANAVAREVADPLLSIVDCLNELEEHCAGEMGTELARLQHARDTAQAIFRSLTVLGTRVDL